MAFQPALSDQGLALFLSHKARGFSHHWKTETGCPPPLHFLTPLPKVKPNSRLTWKLFTLTQYSFCPVRGELGWAHRETTTVANFPQAIEALTSLGRSGQHPGRLQKRVCGLGVLAMPSVLVQFPLLWSEPVPAAYISRLLHEHLHWYELFLLLDTTWVLRNVSSTLDPWATQGLVVPIPVHSKIHI